MEVKPSGFNVTPAKVISDNQTDIYKKVKAQGMLTVQSPEQNQLSQDPGTKAGTEETQGMDLVEKLEQAVEKLNKMAELFDFRIKFRVHEETQRIISEVIQPESGEVLKEIPSEKLLDMIAKIQEMAGLIIDEYV